MSSNMQQRESRSTFYHIYISCHNTIQQKTFFNYIESILSTDNARSLCKFDGDINSSIYYKITEQSLIAEVFLSYTNHTCYLDIKYAKLRKLIQDAFTDYYVTNDKGNIIKANPFINIKLLKKEDYEKRILFLKQLISASPPEPN